jgi:hypothetical protein
MQKEDRNGGIQYLCVDSVVPVARNRIFVTLPGFNTAKLACGWWCEDVDLWVVKMMVTVVTMVTMEVAEVVGRNERNKLRGAGDR